MPSEKQSDEKKITDCIICEQLGCCTVVSSRDVANAWAPTKVAGTGPTTCGIFQGVAAALIARPTAARIGAKAGVFRGQLFALRHKNKS
jgi:hypothetical protein